MPIKAMRDDLDLEYFWKWVVVSDEKLVSAYEAFEGAANDVVAHFGRGPYLIRLVREGPLTMPVSVLYRPYNADD